MSKNKEREAQSKHLTNQKISWLHQDYPSEDIEGTEIFKPFFRRQRTWLVLVGLIIFLLSLNFLPVEFITHAEKNLEHDQVQLGLGIFALIAFLWLTEALPLPVTALLVPVLASLSGLMSVQKSLSYFADPLIFLFLGGFALSAAMAYQGLDRWIANRLIRLGNGSFLKASLFLFSATALLSMWMSNTATTAMMIPLVLGVLSKVEGTAGKPAKQNSVFLLLGVAYAASIGGIGTIVGSPPNGIAAQQLGLGFLDWMKFGVPMMLILLPLMVVILYLCCRPLGSGKVEVDPRPFSFNWHRLTTLGIFACTALAWIFSRQLGSWTGIAKGIDTVIALCAIFALLYFRVVRWRDIDNATDWGVLLLFGGGITLSAILKESGASLFLSRLFVDSVHGLPLVIVIGAIVTFVILLTELSSNTATAALLVPIFYSVALEMNLTASLLVVPLAIAASCAFMLPVATPPNAIVFGTGKIPQRTMMRVGLFLNLAFILVLTPLAYILF